MFVITSYSIHYTKLYDDILAMIELANMRISKHELSAFFRNPNQHQFRPCNDQVLRNFLKGMQIKYKDTSV